MCIIVKTVFSRLSTRDARYRFPKTLGYYVTADH